MEDVRAEKHPLNLNRIMPAIRKSRSTLDLHLFLGHHFSIEYNKPLKVYLNDQEQNTTEGELLLNFLTAHQLAERNGIAVALNQEVVPKTEWNSRVLKNEDQIMIITATAGG